MEVLDEQKDGSEHDLVQSESTHISLSPKIIYKNGNENGHSKVEEFSGEGESDSKKKKINFKAGKKNHRGSMTKASPKTRRNVVTEDSDRNKTLLSKSEHNPRNRNMYSHNKSNKYPTRRQSMSSMPDNKGKKRRDSSARIKMTRSGSFSSVGSGDHESNQTNPSNRSLAEDSTSRKHSNRSVPNPSDGNDFDGTETHHYVIPKSQNQSISNRSLNSDRSQKNQNRPSSNRSLTSDSKTLTLSSHSYDKNYDARDFASGVEDDCETKCSVDNISLVINHGNDIETSAAPTTSNDEDSNRIRQGLCEGTTINRDPVEKIKGSRQLRLSKTDELGRGSSHYKLEGVYFNARLESKVQRPIKNELDAEIQVLTKLTSNSKETDGRNKNPMKCRFRSRRRESIAGDEFARARSKSREQARAREDFTRMRSARSLDRLSSRSLHMKNGYSAKLISPKSQEAVKKLLGLDPPSFEEDSIVAKSIDQKALAETKDVASERKPSSPLSTKDTSDTSVGEIEKVPFDNQPSSINDSLEIEKVINKLESPTKNLDEKHRRRSSVGKMLRKEKAQSQQHIPVKQHIELSPRVLEGDLAEITNKEIKDLISESRPSFISSRKDMKESFKTLEGTSKERKPPSKALEKKQRRKNSVGKISRKDRISAQSQEVGKKLNGSGSPLSDEDRIVMKNAYQNNISKNENIASGSCSSLSSPMNDKKESSSGLEKASSKNLESPLKDLEKKQRKRNSVGKTSKKERHPQDALKKLINLGIPLSEEDSTTIKPTDHKDVLENENMVSNNRPSSSSLMKESVEKSRSGIESTISHSQPQTLSNNVEKSIQNTEKLCKKVTSPNEDPDKNQRRRNSVGKYGKKDTTSLRISTKSGHKSRKPTREKKTREKRLPLVDGNPRGDPIKKDASNYEIKTSIESTTSSTVEESVSPSKNEINETLNHEAKERVRSRSSKEKSSKNDRSTRRSSIKERNNAKNESEMSTLSNEKIISSSAKEVKSEDEMENKDSISHEAEILNPLTNSFLKSDYASKDYDSNDTCSLADSNLSEEKDDENMDDANYLQLTFVTENGSDANNLFTLMDEKFNQSFHTATETEDRNYSLRSFVSFTEEIDLKVSTTSYSLSRRSIREKGVDGVLADEDSPYDDDDFTRDFANDFVNNIKDESTTKKKKVMTPVSKKKKVSPFSLSKSLHEVGRYRENIFGDGIGEDSPRRKKRGVLRKMKTGITEGGRRTFHKAASTRNMLGQATTKALARRKEEGRGLLSNGDDSE